MPTDNKIANNNCNFAVSVNKLFNFSPLSFQKRIIKNIANGNVKNGKYKCASP